MMQSGNPWSKLILVSLGMIFVSVALLWSLVQFTNYNNYNMYYIQGKYNMPVMMPGMNMQMYDDSFMGGMMR